MEGLGVLINRLGGNEKTVAAVQQALGKVLIAITLDDNKLTLTIDGGARIVLWDDGQSCCESRYMRTDDDLASFVGATVQSMELAAAPNVESADEYGEEHEVQFLRILTDKGPLVLSNHNEHNGYYGGFSIAAKVI